jgi:hypothetical protein
MRRHFFSIGRLLLERDQAREIRDNPAWFDVPAPEPVDSSGAWDELLGLLDTRWHPLAAGLRTAGVPPPRDVDWDILVDGRVSGDRAVMVWDGGSAPVVLIEDARFSTNECRSVVASPDADPHEIAVTLHRALVDHA